jgi:hypothetical protein
MNKCLFITSILIAFILKEEPRIEVVRSLFYEAASNRQAAQRFSQALSVVNNNSSPILLCYKGVATMIQAKHVVNPFSKLERFKNGKTMIEKSIKRDPDDLELRFLRFSIQSNLPGFLGYDEQITGDKLKLLNGYGSIKDVELRKRILSYLATSKYLTEEELKKIAR